MLKMVKKTFFIVKKIVKEGLFNGSNVVPEGCPVEDFAQLLLQTWTYVQ